MFTKVTKGRRHWLVQDTPEQTLVRTRYYWTFVSTPPISSTTHTMGFKLVKRNTQPLVQICGWHMGPRKKPKHSWSHQRSRREHQVHTRGCCQLRPLHWGLQENPHTDKWGVIRTLQHLADEMAQTVQAQKKRSANIWRTPSKLVDTPTGPLGMWSQDPGRTQTQQVI